MNAQQDTITFTPFPALRMFAQNEQIGADPLRDEIAGPASPTEIVVNFVRAQDARIDALVAENAALSQRLTTAESWNNALRAELDKALRKRAA